MSYLAADRNNWQGVALAHRLLATLSALALLLVATNPGASARSSRVHLLAEGEVAGLSVQAQILRVSATTSSWSLSQSLTPPTLDLHGGQVLPAHLVITVRRSLYARPAVLHLAGSIQLTNSSAQPIPIARITAQLATGSRGSTPLTPIMFNSPLAAGAQMVLPFALAVHPSPDLSGGSNSKAATLRIVVSVPGERRTLTAGADVPLAVALPAPRAVESAQIALRTDLLLTNATAFAATLGAHPAGAKLVANGASFATPVTLPPGGSHIYRLDLRLSARQIGSGRLLATTRITAGTTDVTDCDAGAGCPNVGVVLIGGE
jgi:hypothetical protein